MAGSHTVVVGGGVVGLSAAYFLARRGERVTVVERDAIGIGASSGNAGILALGHPPLPRPGLVRQLPRLVFDRMSPLHIPFRLDPGLFAWMVRFLLACRRETYTRSLELLCEMGWAAGACFADLVAGEGIECEYHQTGWLEVFHGEAAFHHGRKDAEALRRVGYRVEEHSGRDLRGRFPAFREGLAGALHYTDSGFANPDRFMMGLAVAARRRGVTVLEETEVSRIRIESGRLRGVVLRSGEEIAADRLVLAAGVWTTALARSAGIRIPMQAGKGYHLDLTGVDARPGTTSVLAETFVAVTPLGNGLRLAGTVELSGTDLRERPDRMNRLLAGARRYLEGIERAQVASTWCGLRPLTADGLPVIGWARETSDIFITTGHAMMGFLLGPLTGRIASEMILGDPPSVDVALLSAHRF